MRRVVRVAPRKANVYFFQHLLTAYDALERYAYGA
jgi:hypothetical protein